MKGLYQFILKSQYSLSTLRDIKKKRTQNVERKNSIIENHFVIMKKIKQIKNFIVESKKIPFYKFHVSILFVCQCFIYNVKV